MKDLVPRLVDPPSRSVEPHRNDTSLGPSEEVPMEGSLVRLLVGRADSVDLPTHADLALAAAALASGRRRRVLLPVATSPLELCLERRADDVLVSLYTTSGHPEVLVRERKLPLASLLEALVEPPADEGSRRRRPGAVVGDRSRLPSIEPMEADDELCVRGGASEAPRRGQPLAFGYEIRLRGATRGTSRGVRADVHALLFDGTLTAFVHGRRLVLAKGAVMLPLLRLLAAARTVAEARRVRQVPHVRVRHGSFAVSFRYAAEGKLTLTLEGERGETVTAAALDVDEALLPIARLGADVVKELIAFDPSQTRNLRVRAVREDIRTLRRLGKIERDRPSFTCEESDRYRALAVTSEGPTAPSRAAPNTLRFGERWRLALDGLDATSTFLCGDRLVVSSSKHTVAISRDDGAMLWAREAESTASSMAGDVLVRARLDGHVELCRVTDGEPYATARMAARSQVACPVFSLTEPSTPPTAVLMESPTKLVGIDLRTGEMRYRFAARRGRPVKVERRGRVLVVGSEEGVHGIDGVTGEELWRHNAEAGAVESMVVAGDRVAAHLGGPAPRLVALDAFSGRVIATRTVAKGASVTLVAHDRGVLFGQLTGGIMKVQGLDERLEPAFEIDDPGLSGPLAATVFDGRIVLNSAGRSACAIDVATGERVWAQTLSGPTDDVPRVLDPVLRAGALFVPGGNVAVLRPHDGQPIVGEFPCDLVPDRVLVDERTWVYVAEESGHLAAYAPVAHLTLIRGGG